MIRAIPSVAGILGLCIIALAPGVSADEDVEFTTFSAWQEGAQVQFIDFGANTPLATDDTVVVAPVWVIVDGVNDDGSPHKVDGQGAIFDVNLGDPGYTDLWQMYVVTAPDGYEANSIRSVAELEAAGLDVQEMDVFVNCPFVDKDAEVPGRQVAQGWVDGEEVYYVDFGPASDAVGQAWVVANEIELYEGYVEFEDSAVILDESDATFRKLNLVVLPPDTEADSITSADDLTDLGLDSLSTDQVHNLQLVDEAAPPASEPDSGYRGPAGSTSSSLRWFVFGAIGLGALAIAGAAFVTTRSASNAS